MKHFNTLFSIGILLVALPAQSAVIKEKSSQPKKTSSTPAQTAASKKVVEQPQPQLSEVSDQTQMDQIAGADLTLTSTIYPKLTNMQWVGTDINALSADLPKPTLGLSNIIAVPTVIVPQTTKGSAKMDVSVIDDFITYASPMARHYPPVFNSRTDRYNTIQRIKQLTTWIDTYAENNNASYDVLLRATKLNAMGRNLDLGSDYAVRASKYVARAIKLNDTAEANFLYGAMLSEGGGFEEGAKYLEKAERMGFSEATQSLAQADLLNDKKERALQRLNDFKAKYPDNPYIDEQLRIANSGEYYIWNIPVKTTR